MAEKAKYTIARTDEALGKTCTCQCSNTVTVYYSAAREAAGQTSFTARADEVQIKVLEVQ